MKPALIILILLNAGSHLVSGQVPVWESKWDHKAGGTDEDILTTFQITPDSGLILCGSSFSGISGDKTESNHDTSLTTSDFWLVKTDSMGIIQWEKRFGGDVNEVLKETIVTSDAGYLSGGQSFSGVSGEKTEPNRDSTLQSNDYWIIKTDGSGQIQWDKRYGGSSYELFGSVCQVADGGFVITGSSFSGADGDKTEINRGGWDYWLLRVDASGTILWDKRFGGFGDDFSNNVVLTADGNYLVAGYSNSGIGGDKSEANRGNWDYWIIKVDPTGAKIWDKTFGGNLNDWLFALSATSDGGFILGGQSHSEASGDKSEPNHDPTPAGSDMWVIRTDSDGLKLWDKTFGGMETDDLGRIIPTADGGFLLSGESYSDIGGDKTESNLGPEQTWVVKIDSTGVIKWDKTIFTYGHDELGSALPWGENCFIAANFTQADTGGVKSVTAWGDGDYWMVKMCMESALSSHELPLAELTWNCYPNPVANEIILYNQSDYHDISVQLFDAKGKQVGEINRLSGTAGNRIHLDSKKLKDGIYFCRIIEHNKVNIVRIIKAG